MARLVFVHGRDQQGKDREALRRKWVAGLNKGLTLAGRAPVDPDNVSFPFYGDLLDRKLRELRAKGEADFQLQDLPVLADEGMAPRDVSEDIAFLQAELMLETAQEVGYEEDTGGDGRPGSLEGLDDVLGWRRFRKALQWLADRTVVPEVVIHHLLSDVAAYLASEEIRGLVLGEVETAVASEEPIVLVGHSLGSVVAFDLLYRLPDERQVPLFVTCGSPLGLPVVQRNLLDNQQPRFPDRVGGWLNAYDSKDVVALAHPLAKAFGGQVTDLEVRNPSYPHAIDDYLADERVAGRIGAV
jgi:endonuclease G, mitochondrial